MDLFKIIVVSVAIFLLIVILTSIGFLINKSNRVSSIYPPTTNQCPDNWMVDGSSNCIIPTNNINLGNLNPSDYSSIPGYFQNGTTGASKINFSDPSWANNGMTSQCNQKLWANTHGIVWDTISNYNQC
jgi:hypothetical protein